MGRYILTKKEARLPYEVEELDLRLYTIEELCYYIYHNLDLISEGFIDDHLLSFIRRDLDLPEIADKIERFYGSPSDMDATLVMLLSEVGFYTDAELVEFKSRLIMRRRKTKPERQFRKARSLYEKKRYAKAITLFRTLVNDRNDVRITSEIRAGSYESMGDAYGHLYCFDRAIENLEKAYAESKEERLLKKIYKVSVLSGIKPSEIIFSSVPESLINKWQKEYWNQEMLSKNKAEDSELLKMFFKDRVEASKELQSYIEKEKEAFRMMSE